MSQSAVASSNPGVNPGRLFLGSCLALIATSVTFAVLGDIVGSLKSQFVLTNGDLGWIGGASFWGFTVATFLLGPFCDALGMKKLIAFAFVCHAAGALMMITATGFWTLFFGALIIAMGNGTVEAVCNPLVATLYPTRKTVKLNQFHVWFPGGIVIGGLICTGLTKMGIDSWQLRLGLILIPTVIYGFLFFGQQIPATERVQSGVSFGEMFQATFLRPLFLILVFCMMITASLELAPNRWIPDILKAGGIDGTLILVWITGLMAVLRFFAGPVVHRISPTGILLVSAVLSGVGLLWLSYAQSGQVALLAATVFALGVCYFWPTMLGVVSERVPKGGSLALGVMGGVGMLITGVVTLPLIGKIADGYLHQELPVVETKAVLQKSLIVLNEEKPKAKGKQSTDIQSAITSVENVLAKATATSLPEPDTALALLAVKKETKAPVVAEIDKILNPANNYGGRMAFRWLAPFAILLIIVFGSLWARDLAAGGYRVEHIDDEMANARRAPANA